MKNIDTSYAINNMENLNKDELINYFTSEAKKCGDSVDLCYFEKELQDVLSYNQKVSKKSFSYEQEGLVKLANRFALNHLFKQINLIKSALPTGEARQFYSIEEVKNIFEEPISEASQNALEIINYLGYGKKFNQNRLAELTNYSQGNFN